MKLFTSQLTQQNTEDEGDKPNKPEQGNEQDEDISAPLLSLKTGKYPNNTKKLPTKTFWFKLAIPISLSYSGSAYF